MLLGTVVSRLLFGCCSFMCAEYDQQGRYWLMAAGGTYVTGSRALPPEIDFSQLPVLVRKTLREAVRV